MAEIKTKPTGVAVDQFLDAVPDPQRRADGKALREMIERMTGEPATMWGPSIVGFGSYHYKYDSGHEGDMARIGFSPREAELVLYVLTEARGTRTRCWRASASTRPASAASTSSGSPTWTKPCSRS